MEVKGKIKIIYIAGYGRSGSTLLSMLLNTIDGVDNLGEVSNLYTIEEKFLDQKWIELKSYAMDKSQEKGIFFKNSGSITWFLKKKIGIKTFAKQWDPIIKQYCNNENVHIVVDASKTTNKTYLRPYYYKKLGYEVKCIHLIRNLSGVVASYTKGKNISHSTELQKPKRGGALRAIFNWFFTNTFTSLQYGRFLSKNEYKVVDYDKFVSDFRTEMPILLSFLDLLSNEQLFEKLILLKPDKSFAGNRVRLKESIEINEIENPKFIGIKGKIISFVSFLYKLIEPSYVPK